MKKNIVYFEVTSEEAFNRLKFYFSNRFLPWSVSRSLKSIEGESYPLYLKLDSLTFSVVSREEVEKPVVVRTKTKIVRSETVTKVNDGGLDLYPKFKRSSWNSFGLGYRITSLEDYKDFCMKLAGSYTSCEKHFSGLKVAGTVIAFIKEGVIVVCIEHPKGVLFPIGGVSDRDMSLISKARIIDYSKDYVFPSPIELY